ncbi:MAG: preprotein translocase subunit YajC [Phycisphaerae bacterium]|nr:preprotein translocase subunit YajC [Phycisphaerae bacterium]
MMINGYSVLSISLGQSGATDPTAPPPAMSSGALAPAHAVTTSADGIVQEGAAPAGGPFGDNFFLVLVFVMVAVVGFSMLSGRKQKKQKKQMMAAISKGDTIQTIGGIIGRIVELKPDTALLEVDRNSNSRMAISRAAIQQVVESSDTPEADTASSID